MKKENVISQLHTGVYRAVKKNGTEYYRASITFRNKHISLGSFDTESKAHRAYREADQILHSTKLSLERSLWKSGVLSFEKKIVLFNFRDNDLYIANPIYLKKHYFEYYLSETDICKFDIDDLFYYSSHKIIRRGGHLCVADYGSQLSILSRYKIKPYAVYGRDYLMDNDDPLDFRRSNLEIINLYNGVFRKSLGDSQIYRAVIHLNGNFLIGEFEREVTAAIAYNKCLDEIKKLGVNKKFTPNYIESISPITYATVYSEINIPDKILTAARLL